MITGQPLNATSRLTLDMANDTVASILQTLMVRDELNIISSQRKTMAPLSLDLTVIDGYASFVIHLTSLS